ncbi:glycoside hydrolase family 15 [Candidatus Woesearchaeota archaeon]|nr:glycoside hydrolase family 15 [Candidatus Woesearchaeota archaeon]
MVSIISRSIALLQELQHPSGLFSASKAARTGYNLAWIRDNIYIALGLEAAKKLAELKKTYRALLDILLKHEYKIDWMIKEPNPKEPFRYIHARYHPETKTELHDEWGNKQNDAVGALLFKIGELERKGVKIIRNEHDTRLLQKLVHYLQAIEYWQDKDNGMWEENEEVHASSIGACVAGLKSISAVVDVPKELILKGEAALHKLLPSESDTKKEDLALLSLIYPYNIVNDQQREAILKNIEKSLIREKGLIRYKGDKYYSNGSEAEWVFGFPWLATIYKQLNNPEKYSFYMKKTLEAANKEGELPELYYGKTAKHNENSPLGWAQAMFLVAVEA